MCRPYFRALRRTGSSMQWSGWLWDTTRASSSSSEQCCCRAERLPGPQSIQILVVPSLTR